MDSLTGASLTKADGTLLTAETALQNKEIVLYYFSAHWCPPCRHFTPKLKEFYEKAKGMGVEIIFVSSDETSEDMIAYMKEAHGDWLAVEHESPLSTALSAKYDVSGIPTLIVCKKDGSVVSKDGRDEVGAPDVAQTVRRWKE